MDPPWRSIFDEAEALAAAGDVQAAAKAFMRAANAAAAKEARRDGALCCMRLADMRALAGDETACGLWGSAAFDVLTFEIDDPILIDVLASRLRTALSLAATTPSMEALVRGSVFMGAQFMNDNEQLFRLAVQIGAARLDKDAARRLLDDAARMSSNGGRADLQEFFLQRAAET